MDGSAAGSVDGLRSKKVANEELATIPLLLLRGTKQEYNALFKESLWFAGGVYLWINPADGLKFFCF